MKLNTFDFPKSSFLSVPKDLGIILNKLSDNKNISKLLKCPTKDWQDYEVTSLPDLIEQGYISIIPKTIIVPEIKTYLIITFGSFIPNATNTEFRDNVINIDIMCHFDTYSLGNLEMRPYRIAGEIDSMLDKKKLTGIGELLFVSGDNVVYNNEFFGVTMTYYAIHGEEDKIDPYDGSTIP